MQDVQLERSDKDEEAAEKGKLRAGQGVAELILHALSDSGVT